MLRAFFKVLLRLFYRVEIKGLENYRQAGKRTLIVANHTSFLDALLLASFLPDRLSFAINTHISQRWYSRLIKPFVNLFVMDPTNPLSLKSLIRYVQQDKKVVIFPEGRITVTGSLMTARVWWLIARVPWYYLYASKAHNLPRSHACVVECACAGFQKSLSLSYRLARYAHLCIFVVVHDESILARHSRTS